MSSVVLEATSAPSQADELYERVSGALLGGAIADALGWPTEFSRTPIDLQNFGVDYPILGFVPWHKRAGGRFFTRIDYVQPGEYSDDTQLTLAVMRSLRADGTVDNAYFAKEELRYWLDYARGAGATVTAAAKAAQRKSVDWRWNYFRFTRGRRESDYRDAGANGAAMRVSPIALANLSNPSRTFLEVWKNAIVTHGHPRAILGATTFAEALRAVLNREIVERKDIVQHLAGHLAHVQIPRDDDDVSHWLHRWNEHGKFEVLFEETRAEMLGLLSEVTAGETPLKETYDRLGCLRPSTKGSGTHSVAAALAVFVRYGDAFGKTALAAANMLGSDTDTIGAMAASMSGASLGYTAIPEEWATLMADYSYFGKAAEVLTQFALARGPENRLRLSPYDSSGRRPEESILDQLRLQVIRERRRIWHPFFGEGLVQKVESQVVGNRRGRVILATVKFEIGQTCKFSSYKALTPEQLDLPEEPAQLPLVESRERQVREAFVTYLVSNGWEVEPPTGGADVIAKRNEDRLVAEVKGTIDQNAGLDVDTAYGQLLRRMWESSAVYALVLPRQIAKLGARVPKAVRDLLRIRIYDVDLNGDVSERDDP